MRKLLFNFFIIFSLMGTFCLLYGAQIEKNKMPREVNSYVEGNPLEGAILVAKIIEVKQGDRYTKPSILAIIATKYMARGQYAKALELGEMLRYTDEKAEILAQVATGYAKIGENAKALDILSEAFNAAQTIKEDYYKGYALIEVACGYVQAGNDERVSEISNLLAGKPGHLVRIAEKYIEIGQREKGLQLLSRALQLGRNSKEWRFYDGVLLGTAKIYIEINDYDRALETARTISQTYWHDKNKILKDLALKYAQAGQYEKAIDTATAVHYIQSDVLADIAVVCIESRDCNKTKDLIQAIRDIKLNYNVALALNKIVSKYIEINENEKAKEILALSFETAKDVGKPEEKAAVWSEIAWAYAKLGDAGMAEKIFQETFRTVMALDGDYYKAEGLIHFLDKYSEVQPEDKIKEMLLQAFEIARTLREPHPGDSVYSKANILSHIAIKYTRLGLGGTAIDLAARINDGYSKVSMLATIASEYAKTGKKDEALKILSSATEIAKRMKGSYFEKEAFSRISYTYADIQEGEEASKIALKLDSAWFSGPALNKVVSNYMKAKQYAEVLKEVRKKGFVFNMPYPYSLAKALTEIGFQCLETGDKLDDETKKILAMVISEFLKKYK